MTTPPRLAGGEPPPGAAADGGAPGFLHRLGDDELAALVTRRDLPPTFERWQLTLAPGAERAASAAQWAGALVLIARGSLEVACGAGGRRIFDEGDLLVLGWLPLRALRNPGDASVHLVAVRCRGERPPEGLLRVIRHIRHRPGDPAGQT